MRERKSKRDKDAERELVQKRRTRKSREIAE